MEKKPKELDAVKKEVRSLLLSSPIGLNLQDLLSDYRSMIGSHLPFQQLGYSSALDFIKDIPDVVYPVFRAGGVMYLEAVADNTTAHIKKLVLRQKRSGKVSSIRKPVNESVRRPPPKSMVPAIVRMKIKELLRSSPNGIEASEFGTTFKNRFAAEIDYQKLGFPSMKRLLQECSDFIRITERKVGGKSTEVLFFLSRQNSTSSLSDMDEISPRGQSSASSIKTNLKPQAKRNNSRSPSQTSGQQKKSGNSPAKSPKSIENRSTLMELEPEQAPPKVKTDRQRGITSQSGVSDQLKMEIKKLLEGKGNGMWLARLPFEYKRCYKKELEMSEAGYYNLITLVGSIPDVVRIERPVNNGDWLLLPSTRVKEVAEEDPLPPDVVKYDGMYQKLSHPTEGAIEIFIVHIDNPGSFFFHWCKQKILLDKLMIEMSVFYKSVSSQKYMLPASHRKTGQVCCAVYDEDGEWYRAIIVHSVSESEEVEVIFTDYGDKAVVKPNDLRLLRKDFLGLPAMGLKGSLANIKPFNSDKWLSDSSATQEAATRFFELSQDKVLLGKIHKYEEGVLSLDLADTNFNRHVHINDVLVIENLASYDKPQREPLLNLQSQGVRQLNQTAKPVAPMFPNPISPLPQPNPFFNNAASLQALQLSLMNSMLYASLPQNIQAFSAQPVQQAMMDQRQRLLQMNGQIDPMALPMGYPSQQGNNFRYDIAASGNQQMRRSSSIDSLIECINSELDGKNSSDEEKNDEEVSKTAAQLKGKRNWNIQETAEEERKPSYSNIIKSLQVPEPYQLHVLNVDGKPFVTRGEVAALIWHRDILRTMLRQYNVPVSPIVITKEDNSLLFECLAFENVKDLVENEGKDKTCLMLFELESLPTILDTFKHKSEVLKTIIKAEINCYKSSPENYWEAGESTSSDSEDIESDSQALELELEELRLLLQAMQFRRKRLVNSLMSKAPPQDAVNELERVEQEVEKIRKKVRMKEQSIKC